MFFFNKKHTIAASGILAGATDHHSHILPGVDDGVDTMDEALRILAAYETLGIKALWLTPHIMEDIPNSPQKLHKRFEELKATYNGCIQLHLAAEYMTDNLLCKLLQETPPRFRGEVVEDRRGEKSPAEATMGEGDKTTEPQGEISLNSPSFKKREYPKGEGDRTTEQQGEISLNSPSFEKREYPKGEGDRTPKQDPPHLLPIGNKGKHILVETSYYNAPMRMNETLQLIKSLGYQPLLAHPERYMYLDNAEYAKLHSQGIKFQLNLASLAGGYGPAVKKKAHWLLNNGLYNVAGTDLHSQESISLITKCKLSKQHIEQVERLLHNSI